MKVSIPILMYHQVCPVAHSNFLKFTVTTDMFTAQMKVLKRLGFNPITFGELIDSKERLHPLPSKPIIITFDDVLEDAVENAIPILEKSEFKAVFYTPTQYLGKTSSWMLSDVGVEFRLINRQQLRNLDAKGFEIGSHTITHPYLNKISSELCYKELEGSRSTLEDILGHEVRHMAYPFGAYNKSVKKIANEVGYVTACTAQEHIPTTDHDLLLLPRLNIGMEESLLDFILKIHTAQTPRSIINKGVKTSKNLVPKPLRKILKKLLSKNK